MLLKENNIFKKKHRCLVETQSRSKTEEKNWNRDKNEKNGFKSRITVMARAEADLGLLEHPRWSSLR